MPCSTGALALPGLALACGGSGRPATGRLVPLHRHTPPSPTRWRNVFRQRYFATCFALLASRDAARRKKQSSALLHIIRIEDVGLIQLARKHSENILDRVDRHLPAGLLRRSSRVRREQHIRQ